MLSPQWSNPRPRNFQKPSFSVSTWRKVTVPVESHESPGEQSPSKQSLLKGSLSQKNMPDNSSAMMLPWCYHVLFFFLTILIYVWGFPVRKLPSNSGMFFGATWYHGFGGQWISENLGSQWLTFCGLFSREYQAGVSQPATFIIGIIAPVWPMKIFIMMIRSSIHISLTILINLLVTIISHY